LFNIRYFYLKTYIDVSYFLKVIKEELVIVFFRYIVYFLDFSISLLLSKIIRAEVFYVLSILTLNQNTKV